MNMQAPQATGTDLAVMSQPLQAAAVFAPGGVDDILAKLKAEVRAIPTDISTAAGRKQIASLAYKIARSKTALDEMGKNLVAEWKAKAAAVDADRRKIRDELDALRDEVRRPLDEWEAAEEARVKGHETALADLAALAVFDTPEPAIETIDARLHQARTHNREWQEFSARAAATQSATIASLEGLRERRVKQEAERAELARLKAEEEERKRREREEQIAREAAEKARKEAEEKAAREAREAAEREAAERARVEREAAAKLAAEKAERERVEREKREAEERAAKAEADRIAAEKRAEEERKAAAERAEREAKEAAERAEREKQAAVEAERKRLAEEQAREKAEAEKREANKRHAAKINGEVVADLVANAAISEATARAVVTAIAKGQVRHTRISY